MKKKEIKVGDILFVADVVDPLNFAVHEVEIISFNLTEDEKKCGWDVECAILSDDLLNGASYMTHTDRIFKTRKETLDYISLVLSEKQLGITIATDKLKKELQEEEERLEKRRIIKQHAAFVRKRLLKLNELITKIFKDPLIDLMFEEVEENSQFTCALDVLLEVLSFENEKREKGWNNLIKEIFESGEDE